jgi:nitrate/nitrite transporter NarK
MAFFYNDKFRIESVEIGLILSVSDFIGLLASWVAGRLSNRAGRKPLIEIESLLSRVCGFVLLLTDDVTQAGVVLRARSLEFNISMSPLGNLRADRTPKEARGRYFGARAT